MATAGHLGIATPGSDGGPSERSINPDDISFGSQEASFKSPSKLNKENQPAKHAHSFLNRLQKPTGSTPLSEIKNPQNPIVRPPVRGPNEFTPMLKSASKNRLMKAMGQPTPSRLRTSNLPQMMEEDEDSVMVEGETGVEVSTANLQSEEKLADMSSVSASFQKLPSRSPGSNDGAALLTLREQEKVIDEMRKENFSLKLKIFFMQDRLGKLAPEHIQAVLQENLEYKVEQATLRHEMKKYKRSLLDAERNIQRMAEEIKQTKENTGDPASFVCPLDHGMSDEEAAEFKRAQEEAEDARNEAMFAKQEADELKRELWEVKREKKQLEDEGVGSEDVAVLEGQIEELRGVNEDLDLELKGLREEVEQKNDELDVLQDQLEEEKQRVKDLHSRGVGPLDEDEIAQELQQTQEELNSLNNKLAETQQNLTHATQEFEIEKDQLQTLAAEHKSSYEKIEADLQALQEEYAALEKELDQKEPMDGDVGRLQEQIKDLQAELEAMEFEKVDLEDQVDSLKKDAAQLLDKDTRVSRERAEERRTLQADIEELQIQLRETLEQHARNIEEYEKETARLEQRYTAAESQKSTLKHQIDQLMQQDPTANGHTDRIQRVLLEETDRHRSEVEALQSQLDRLTSDLRDSRTQTSDLESDLAALNEELRTARRVEDSLNQEIQSLREKTISGSRDGELLRKLQAENTEFRAEVSRLHDRLDKVSTTRDRLAGQVNGLESQNTEALHRHLSEAEKERDIADAQVRNMRSQLEDTKRQVEIQATQLRLTEQNLADARDDLAREQARATNLLASPHSAKHITEVRKLEDLLQQSRLRCAEMGKVNATQLGNIDALNRKVRRLEGELEVFQRQPRAGDGERGLHSQLTLAKGQLADAKAQLAKQEADFARRMEAVNRGGYTADLRSELARLEKAQRESGMAKEKLEDQVRSLTRQIARLESDVAPQDDRALFSRYQALKAEMDVLREEADVKDVKSAKQLRRVQEELEEVRDHASALERDLGRQKATVRRQVVDTAVRGRGRLEDVQVEKRHGAELRGLGKQIRYLKAKLFREQNFRADLQYAKSFFLMQINCFESYNKANLLLLQQMGIYPEPEVRNRRPKMRSVALFVLAMTRMRRLKNDWAEHKKAGKELKDGMKRMKHGDKKWVVV